jgi:hypothetical protein
VALSTADWAVLAAYFLLSFGVAWWLRGRAQRSLADFFVSGRGMPWWIAGTSMVATTFAVDTPLAVTGLTASFGIAGNWLWWSLLLSGMMTVFFFARLWRRSGVLTDVEVIELRYAGRPAAFLRGFRALYLGVAMNCLIMGWVNLAMVKILSISLGLDKIEAVLICLAITAIYTTISLGGADYRSLPIRADDGDDDCAGLLRRWRRRRPRSAQDTDTGDGRQRRLLARIPSGSGIGLDASHRLLGLHRRQLVGQLVSGRRAGRRWLCGPAHLLRQG